MTDDEKGSVAENTTLVQEIRCAINRLSMERESNTPDYVLAEFLSSSFAAFNAAVNKRETHYGRNERPGNCKIDDKGAGEWAVNNPYDHEDCDSDFGGCGDKCKRGAYENGYTDGRKAAEKEYEAKIGLDYTISTSVKLAAFNKLENDFRDLFNIANEMAMNLDSFTDEAGNCHIKFHAWKKARGIE
jgi:hypothetical protein